MAQKPRRDEILQYLEQNGFSTVGELVELLHYSTATVYRDLNELEHQNLVRRSYGGVELVGRGTMTLARRYDYMQPEKRHLAAMAAEYVKDGETISLAGGSTVACMVPYLGKKKNISVIVHDLRVAEQLGALGVDVICLGGRICDPPSILMGDDTVENAMKYRVDKIFFSATGLTPDGQISVMEKYYLLYHVMMQGADKVCFLADHTKLEQRGDRRLCDFSAVDYVVSDIDFSGDIRGKYPKTEFVFVDGKVKRG